MSDMDWPDLGSAAIRKAVELTEERDRARAIAVVLEQQVARLRDLADGLDRSATRDSYNDGARLRRIANSIRVLTRSAAAGDDHA